MDEKRITSSESKEGSDDDFGRIDSSNKSEAVMEKGDDLRCNKAQHATAQVSEFRIDSTDATNVEIDERAEERGRKSRRRPFSIPMKSPTTKIILVSSIVAIPMIVFSIIILALVFGHQMGQITCPHLDLCPRMNQTSTKYYYVDFPATQLVFIASWSSSISLSLVGMLMFLFSFCVSKHFVSCSAEGFNDSKSLPTPYQLSLLVKVLNGELLVLWDMFLYKIQSCCMPKTRRKARRPATATILYKALLVLLLGIAASAIIQATDTWLHIDTDTVELIDIRANQDSSANQYSRGLGPWCTGKPTMNNSCNKYFWGCGIECFKEDGATNMAQSNQSATHNILVRRSPDHDVFNFTDRQGINYAILGPAHVPEAVDWSASTFAVSSQCQPVLPAGCDVHPPPVNATMGSGRLEFDCDKQLPGFSGNISHQTSQVHYVNAHKLINDSAAFDGWQEGVNPPGLRNALRNIAPNLTEHDEVFNNPWRWQGVLPIVDSLDPLFRSEDERMWNRSWIGVPLMVLDCNTTVWEVTYSMVNSSIRSLTPVKANSSVAGIGSMPAFPAFGLLDSELPEVIYDANDMTSSLDTMISSYKFGMSRSFLAHIGGQSSPRPSIQSQTRVPKLIAKVSKAALWTLIVANLFYAAIGITLAVIAIRVGNKEVYNFRPRLTTGGLAAEIFEKPFSDRPADDEWDLFRESRGLGSCRVGAAATESDGMSFRVGSANRRTVQRDAGFGDTRLSFG